MSKELKPCPFCGGTPTFESALYIDETFNTPAYIHCPCGGQSGMSESDSQAKEYWNRRPIEDKLKKKLEVITEKAKEVSSYSHVILRLLMEEGDELK